MVSSQPEAPLSAYRKPGCAVHFNRRTSSTLSRSRTSRRSRLPTSREPALAQQPGVAGGSLEEIPIIERSRFFHGHTNTIGSETCALPISSRRSRLPTSREPALAQQPGVAGGSLEEIPIIERSRFFHGHTH